MALLSAGEFPFGTWQYVETIVGLLIAIAIGWAGARLVRRRPGAGPRATWALAAFLAYAAIVLVARASGAGAWHVWLQRALNGRLLPDMVCVAALLWFIATGLAAPDPEERRIPRVVDLALLVLVGREALPLLAAPDSVAWLVENVGRIVDSPVCAGLTIIGTVLAMAVAALALARITGARVIAPATSVLLAASLFYAFILLGTQTSWQAHMVPGMATHLSLYAAGVITLIERGMLLAALSHESPAK